ncbi:phytanoyl-CoA dioxygenase family protein [Alkalilimnicola sp. S0819]|uniref:phytanoyl-CoA dioxygenase family protein n=1 Tax=Alkalilimnicola sp. S0819 TaxID=2613922 RepID=UPI0012617785|nr:phytanoyl-CoA dioxygenase family protein [Alkalilimnicola sp. S0819]KAB7624367.1 phytanoyl-CoA dioxygenase family protein [Alkalilimnicola sp. S0819]MPQ16193.1 phytanoyl-CoA dioxygenase family protein [Alkalilimnicola sp. S0819]
MRSSASGTPRRTDPGFSQAEQAFFAEQGYLIARGLADETTVSAIRQITLAQLAERREPLELEADLVYPGAPASRQAEGGQVVRRLLQAYHRAPALRAWVHDPALLLRLHQLLGPRVRMPLAHHNCIMTKHPRFSSDTLWHQDIRYWRYSRAELITAWLALGHEHRRNGGLQLIPGSHRLTLAQARFDEALFFRNDLPENQPLLGDAQAVELQAGDVLFFHCRLLHAATRNHESGTKYAAVFTFRRPDDLPLPGTRSASLPDVCL